MRIGSIDAETNEVTWLNQNVVRYNGRFLYSCLTQIEGGNLGIVYENQSESDGGKDVVFDTFSVSDILGEDWSYISQVPRLDFNHRPESMKVGREQKLEAAVEGDGDVSITWSVDEAGRKAVALSDTDSATTTLTAKAAGKATITLTARVKIDGQTVSLNESFRVFVSDKGTTVLPDRYDANAISATYEPPFKVVSGEVKDGGYLIQRAGKLLYMHTGTVTDRIGGGVSNGVVNHSTEARFPLARQTWIFETTEKGTTIKCAATGDYLNVTGQHDDGLPFGGEPTYFTVDAQQDGTYLITTKVGDATYAIDQTPKGNFKSTRLDGRASLPGVTLGAGQGVYTVASDGLKALVADADALDDASGYTPESWSVFASARDAARTALDSHEPTHSDEASAKAAKTELDEAARTLHAAMLDLEPAAPTSRSPSRSPNPSLSRRPSLSRSRSPEAARPARATAGRAMAFRRPATSPARPSPSEPAVWEPSRRA